MWNLQRYAKFNWSIEYSPSHVFNVRYLYAEKKLLKSCYKALDWWVYGLDRMASSADDWRSKSVNRSSWKVEPSSLHRWIFDQLSWHNQLQHLIMNRTWWQIIFWELDYYLQLFYETHLFSPSLAKKELLFKYQCSGFIIWYGVEIACCMVTNLELGWSKLMHILARGHPHLSPKCKTRKRDSDKSSSHLHHFLSSSIFKIDPRLFGKTPFYT